MLGEEEGGGVTFSSLVCHDVFYGRVYIEYVLLVVLGSRFKSRAIRIRVLAEFQYTMHVFSGSKPKKAC